MLMMNEQKEDLKRTLREDIGPAFSELLAGPDVIDIHANPDGRVWIDTLKGRKPTDVALTPERIELIIRHVASYHGRVCNEDFPSLRAVFPLGGERFQGGRPPIASPHFTIRKHLQKVISVSELVQQETLTQAQANVIFSVLKARQNVIFAGMTLSGKTVMVDSILPEYLTLFGPSVRVVTIEDTRELIGAVDNIVMKEASAQWGVQELARDTWRESPDVVILGEVRGAEVIELVKILSSGHGGSMCTVHGGSVREALGRMEMLAMEGGLMNYAQRIASVVHLVVVMERAASDKWRVKEMARVMGWKDGEYLIAPAEGGMPIN